MQQFILSIDNGSQSTKASIFDTQGNEICFANYQLRDTLAPEPGIVLHPDDDLWDSTYGAIERCLKQFQGNPQDIVGVGLCTIRCCRVLLKKDCSLAYPVLSWMDKRLAAPYKHENDNVAYVVSTSGYLAYRLTGEKKDVSSNLEVYWPLDMDSLDWSKDDDVIAKCGLSRDMLFTLIKSGEAFGNLRKELCEDFGLKYGIPVVASSNDKAVEALGAGIISEDKLMISLGTYISAMVSADSYFENAHNFFSTLASIPFKYVYESSGIRRGMWTVSWYKKLMGMDLISKAQKAGLREDEYLNVVGESVAPGSDGLIVILDWLASPTIPYRKGIMIGFDQRHTSAHIFRAILEAIAFSMKNNVDDMLEETKRTVNDLIVVGGGSKSRVLTQIIADVFGLEARTINSTSCACLGAAICVCAHLNIYNSFEVAVENMVKTQDRYSPRDDLYEFYNSVNNKVVKKIRGYTDEVLRRTYPIFK